MALTQLSVLVNNSQGALADITGALAANGINLKALSIADTEHFGILRMIVSDNLRAVQTLKGLGLIARETEVTGVKIKDEPGELAKALKVLSDAEINLEYLYAFCSRSEKHAYMVIRVADNSAADRALTAVGFHMIGNEDLLKI